MPEKFKMNNDKAIHSILFILNELEGRGDFHKVFKILYFADQKHLVSYGRPITGDFYIAMQAGPVPSGVYDIFKFLRGNSVWSHVDPDYHDLFEIKESHFIIAKQNPNLDEFSESDIECLMTAIEENKNLSFQELKEKSHQSAWEKARNREQNDEISIFDIAQEGGANEEIIKYIALNLENQSLLHSYAKLG